MDVERHLTKIYKKISAGNYNRKDRAYLAFFELFFSKRSAAHLENYLEQDLQSRIDDELKKIADKNKTPIPKFRSGSEVYLILEEHDNKPYVINSIHIHRDKKIGYTFLDEERKASNYIYPEALFVHRNTDRLDTDNTSFESFMNNLESQYKSWA